VATKRKLSPAFVGYRTDEVKQPVRNYQRANLSGVHGSKRRRVKHTANFEGRLAQEAIKFKEAAEKQPPDRTARKLLLRRARQAETASHINDWLRSPGLQPPKALEALLSDQRK